MLNVMRDNLRHLKFVLYVVAAAMILSLGLFFDINPTSSTRWAAKIDGKEISIQEYEQAARRIDRRFGQMFGENYDQFRGQIQIGTRAVNELVNRELLIADAARLGLEVSPQELADAIRSEPNLQDASGVFVGREEYERRINGQIPGGTTSFEALLAEDMLVAKWLDVVSTSIAIDEIDMENLHRRRTEKTKVNYVLVSSDNLDVDTDVSDEEARAWYDAHLDDYQRDESRRIEYVVVTRESILDQVQISEADARASYQENLAEFSHPDRRRARHILLRTAESENDEDIALVEQTANGILQQLQDGANFDEMARATSQDPVSAAQGGDLGFFGRGDMVPEFDEAAFNTPVGQLSEVIQTQFGFHILEVLEEQAAGPTPFEEVRAAIELRLQSSRAQELVAQEAERIASNARTLEELRALAERESIDLVSQFIEKNTPLSGIAGAAGFRDSLFTLDVGSVSAPAAVGDGMGILAIVESMPPQVAPFEESREKVTTDIVTLRFREAATTIAQGAMDSGKSLADLADQISSDVRDSGDLAPGQPFPDAPLLAASEIEFVLFGDAIYIGDRGVFETPGGAVAYEVTGREPWDEFAFDDAKISLQDEIRSQRQQVIQQTMLDSLRESSTIELNEAEIKRLDG